MNLIECFESTATAAEKRTAIADAHCSLSFGELRRRARQLGGAVAARGLRESPIAVMAHHDVNTIVFFLACLYSGNFYIPVDPDMPQNKLALLFANAAPQLVLSAHREHDEPLLRNTTGTEVWFDCDERALSADNEGVLAGICAAVDESSTLYVVYTSGSTGEPKGVLKSHGAMLSYLNAFAGRFPFDADDTLGNQTPFFFDASAKDIYAMVFSGVTVQILDSSLFILPVNLIRYLNERHVTFISWVPSALCVVTQLNTFSEILPTSLRRVFFIGESFPMKQLNRWRAALPELLYVNLYGSSELAGACCYRVVGRDEHFADSDALPIGAAFDNSVVRLVADGRRIDKPGTVGEIWISSPALANGYFRDEPRTAAVFGVCDFGDGARRYFRSGDMAQYNARGELVFAARRDNQIKHMGRRIELGEIETAAAALDGVRRCCCLYDTAHSRIVLFCELLPGCALSARELRSQLRGKLSDYMLPNRVNLLDKIPLNANGKTDRQKLKSML